MDNDEKAAPGPWRKGWKAPWRRQWGPMSDGHSRLSYLIRKIERELVAEYAPDTPLGRRRVRRAAELLALGEATMSLIGTDPKATRRAATTLTFCAEKVLSAMQRDRKPKPEEDFMTSMIREQQRRNDAGL